MTNSIHQPEAKMPMGRGSVAAIIARCFVQDETSAKCLEKCKEKQVDYLDETTVEQLFRDLGPFKETLDRAYDEKYGS